MSYSGQSNPPWQRNNLSGNAGGQSLQNNQMGIIGNMQYQQNANSQMYNQNYNNSGQTSVSGGGASLANSLNQIAQASQLFNQNTAVAYPQSRGLNPLAFNQSALNQQQQQSLLGQHPQQQQNQPANKTQSKIGFVTKLHTDCGFVDDEIFFHLKVCKGNTTPKLGDRVLVEASYNPHSPFEWNASRIQIVPTAPNISNSNAQNKQQNQHKSNHQQLQQSARNNPSQLPSLLNMKPTGSVYNAVPPPNEYRSGQRGFSPSSKSKRSPDKRRDSKPRDARERDRIADVIDEIDRKKRREERERSRERRDRSERDRRDISNEKRDRSPVRRSSPKRRRGRGNPRYMVEIPKISLNLSKADVLELRRRYTNLYIPSDFFFTHIKWSESFPPNNPFSIQRPCTFHIMHKSIEPPTSNSFTNSDDLEPTDLDYTFSAKVMLMGFPPIAELYQKSLGLNSNQQQEERDDDRDFIHPSRLINFLVGIRGKNETMAIGGPWSPSLDGENPKDPIVLIKTAIRNCKALTGIDLTGCTQWYRFVELYYHRSESVYKGKTIPGRVETVVIYLPDINSCMPTRLEWTNLQNNYKAKLDQIILNNQANSKSSSSSIVNVVGGGTSSILSTSKLNAAGDTETKAAVADVAAVNTEETGTCEDEKLKPTHFSQLDVKSMKLQNLRDELLARKLSTKGLKPQLSARLTKALNAEKSIEQEENADDENKPIEDDEELKKDENIKDKTTEDNIEDNDEGTVDFDMSDIVVIDEYDGTKTQDEIIAPEKQQPKVMDEKEIAQLERRYKLSEIPQIIVHPSTTAKSGKFDCTIMSLSVLLDYRPEDTKERSFEVSLFAELFNEMLMRDFGFNIYNELMTLPDKTKEKDDEKKKIEDNKPITIIDDDEKSKDSVVEKSKETNKTGDRATRERKLSENDNKKLKDDKTRDKKLSKRSHEDDTDEETHSIRSDRKKKIKLITYIAKKELLLSFVYFDTTHCGFIYEKDLEELFYIIGLNLSRGQIRKLLARVANKDAIHYRKLTDKVKEDETNLESIETISIDEDNNSISVGNLNLLPIFPDHKQKSKISPVKDSNSTMILHNGCLLDVEKLVLQMKRSEKAREEIEQVLSDLTKEHSDLQNSNTKANNKIKDLQSETKSLSKKLRETEDNLFSTNRKYNEHHSIIQNIYDKISPIFAKSARDKDRSDRKDDRDNKIRDDRDKTRETRERKDEKEKKSDSSNRESKNREERNKMENKNDSKECEIDSNGGHDTNIVIKEEKSENVEVNPENNSENMKKEE